MYAYLSAHGHTRDHTHVWEERLLVLPESWPVCPVDGRAYELRPGHRSSISEGNKRTFRSSRVSWEEVAARLPETPALARDRFTGERAPGCPDGQLLVSQTNAGAGTLVPQGQMSPFLHIPSRQRLSWLSGWLTYPMNIACRAASFQPLLSSEHLG